MNFYVRLHKGNHVDAVIPGAVGVAPATAPHDVVLAFTSDVNPSKTIQVTENVQATDPVTNQPLFNADGTPKWKTQNVLDINGNPIPVLDANGQPEVDAKGNPVYEQQIVTQQVPQTVTLLQNPSVFTEADFSGLSYVVVGSLDHKKQLKKVQLSQAFQAKLLAGFQSSADGTARTYALDPLAYSRINGTLAITNAGKGKASQEWKDISENSVAFTPTQFIQFALDAFDFYDSEWQNLDTKNKSVDSATDETTVNGITY